MRVLFVDDEPRVLDGIGRMLFAVGCTWDLLFANSGDEALDVLARMPIDAVISDMRMPRMNGAELLEKVRASWPDTVRLILSGQSDAEAAMRALNVAHRFLSKPCEAGVLIEAVESAIQLRLLLIDPTIRSCVSAASRLPAAPQVYLALNRVMLDPRSDAQSVAAILARDPALTAKTLQLANSAFFRGSRTVGDVQAAVARIGLSAVRNLVLASEVFDVPARARDAETLQSRALQASLLAARIVEGRGDCDNAPTAALLANVGLLLPEALDAARRIDGNGLGHAEIGAFLLGMWGLPTEIVETVAYHRRPDRLPQRRFGTIGAVHVATALVNGDEVDEDYLERLQVAGRLPEWRQFGERLAEQVGVVQAA